MFEGSAQGDFEADFAAALRFGLQRCQVQIAAQKELGQGGKKRQIQASIVPEEILLEAKPWRANALCRRSDASKLAREGLVSALSEEMGKKLVEKFGEEKVTDAVIKDAFYYIQKEGGAQPGAGQRQTPGRARLRRLAFDHERGWAAAAHARLGVVHARGRRSV